MLSLKYITSRLTPGQHVVFLACREIWHGKALHVPVSTLADLTNLTPTTVRKYLPPLHQRGFLRLHISKAGSILLWVRTDEQEKTPNVASLKRQNGLATLLVGPDGENHTVYYGEMRAFCRQYRLQSTYIYDMLNGDREDYKGWRVRTQ